VPGPAAARRRQGCKALADDDARFVMAGLQRAGAGVPTEAAQGPCEGATEGMGPRACRRRLAVIRSDDSAGSNAA